MYWRNKHSLNDGITYEHIWECFCLSNHPTVQSTWTDACPRSPLRWSETGVFIVWVSIQRLKWLLLVLNVSNCRTSLPEDLRCVQSFVRLLFFKLFFSPLPFTDTLLQFIFSPCVQTIFLVRIKFEWRIKIILPLFYSEVLIPISDILITAV